MDIDSRLAVQGYDALEHYDFIVPPGQTLRLSERDPGFTGDVADERAAEEQLAALQSRLAKYQDMLQAREAHSLLVIFQAMDGAAKDGTVKAVFGNLDPQGVAVKAFKSPGGEELLHDYLWRFIRFLPEHGQIGVFNRSYYEEAVTPRIHPEQLDQQPPPVPGRPEEPWWERRYRQINNFEQYLADNGVLVLKFFLHLSHEKQRERLLERTTLPEKQWKFSSRDLEDRGHWDEFMQAYEDMLTHTSTKWAPWHVIPADHRWFTPVAIAGLVVDALARLDLSYPGPSDEEREEMDRARESLEREANS